MSRTKGICGVLGIAMVLMIFNVFTARAMGVRSEGGIIFIENASVRYVISPDGKNLSFFDKLNEKEYLDKSGACNFMTLLRKDKTIPSTSVLYERGQLIVRFNPDWTVIKAKVEVRENYFTIEITEANNPDFDELQFCDLPLTIQGIVGGSLNICRNESFGVAMQSLNYFTNCRTAGWRSQTPHFIGSAYPEFDHIGTKLAVVTGPGEEMLSLIGKLELEQGLAHPTLDGEWNKTSLDAEKSYLFIDYTEGNVDRAIEYAKRGGFKYLNMYLDTWAKTCGKYKINLENYPRGFESVKATVDKIHAAGLKAGAHTMSGSIYKFDEYVTPIPDPRLAKDGERILAADIGPNDDFIPTTESPEGLPLESSYVSSGGTDLQIGNELITYSGYSTTKPYGFTGCKRGAHGTYVSSHKKDDKIYHMAERYNWYMVGGKTTMVDEVAASIAGAINLCGFDWVYYDGSEALAGQGAYWYYVGKVLTAICDRFNREVLVQGSSMPHFNWHHYARTGQIDWVWQDQKRFVDNYTANSYQYGKVGSLMPIEFGWYGYFLDKPSGESSTPDEIEHVLSKCLGYGACWSFETDMETLDGHGRTGEILDMSKNYETARLTRYFSENVKKQLQKKGSDFKLEPDGRGGWTVSPVTYGPDKYVRRLDGKDNKWSYINPYQAQPLKLRLKARPQPSEYDSQDNIVLVDSRSVSKLKPISIEGREGGLNLQVSVSRDQVKSGDASIKLSYTNNSDEASSWAGKSLQLDAPMDLNTYHPLGVWVYGDASGGVLAIQLQAGIYNFTHIVNLDFTGWKYCEFLQASGMDVMKYRIPGHPTLGMRGYNYGKISRVSLFLTNVPAKGKSECYISPVKALKELTPSVSNPGLIVNGQKIVFPVTLRKNDYIEFWGSGKATVYGPSGHTLKEVLPEGAVPTLSSGNNEIESICDAGTGNSIHSRVTIIAKGEPLRD